jgi:leader peptidase (prepilin peptidase)/N-methyltransferase
MSLTLLFSFFLFLFGLAVGSFLNCVIYRLEKKESFLQGRSFCPYCHHILKWQDLIPVLSFLILKGRCRYCGKKISWQYPFVELTTGILFVLVVHYTFPNLLVTSYWLLVTTFLIIIFVYDLKYYIIPDEIIYPAIAVAFLYQILNHSITQSLNHLLSAFFSALFFLIIFLLSQGKWLGFGDVKLSFFMGLFLGFPKILISLFFAFSIGAIIGIALILSGKKTLKSKVPFGPFLVSGTFLALFFGNRVINWYLYFL